MSRGNVCEPWLKSIYSAQVGSFLGPAISVLPVAEEITDAIRRRRKNATAQIPLPYPYPGL